MLISVWWIAENDWCFFFKQRKSIVYCPVICMFPIFPLHFVCFYNLVRVWKSSIRWSSAVEVPVYLETCTSISFIGIHNESILFSRKAVISAEWNCFLMPVLDFYVSKRKPDQWTLANGHHFFLGIRHRVLYRLRVFSFSLASSCVTHSFTGSQSKNISLSCFCVSVYYLWLLVVQLLNQRTFNREKALFGTKC